MSLNLVHVNESTQRGSSLNWKCDHFSALLKDIPMGCIYAVLPEPLIKDRIVHCLTFEKNTKQPCAYTCTEMNV